MITVFFFSSRRRHTRSLCDWSSDVCSSDLWFRSREQNHWHSHRKRRDRRSRFRGGTCASRASDQESVRRETCCETVTTPEKNPLSQGAMAEQATGKGLACALFGEQNSPCSDVGSTLTPSCFHRGNQSRTGQVWLASDG